MTHLGYLIAGWSVALGSMAVYGFFVVRRGRRLTTLVPEDRRRWIDTVEDDDEVDVRDGAR